jgi:putative ABC transport system permease protein
LKGKLQGSSRHTIRKVLVSVQLVLAVFLISSALVMRRQLTFLQDKNLGFNKDQLVVLQLSASPVGNLEQQVGKAFEKAEMLKQELSSNSGVIAMCAASHDFGNGNWTSVGYTDEKGVYRGFSVNVVDAAYVDAMQMQIVSGRNFSPSIPSDARRSVIVNEAFVKEYGWGSALGKKIPGKNFVDHEIIGVVKDFNYESLYTSVKPLVMAMTPAIPLSGSENVNMQNSPIPKLFVRIRAGQIASTLGAVEEAWKKVSDAETFDFSFVDENIGAQYRSDRNLGKIISVATGLAVAIGGLGLYALAALAIQARGKEISIRKVLGASLQSLLMLLSKEFVVLLVINIALSVPITLYFMQRWLQSFQYRIDLSWTLFAIAGAMAITIGFLTIGFEAMKAALARPAEKLKDE